MKNVTQDLTVHTRDITEAEADAIRRAVDDAVTTVIGRSPNGLTDMRAEPSSGEGRSEAEAARAAREGRR
jgi:hypothetical protein